MWAALMVAAVALAGAAFMLRFLVALLREGAPSVCYWVVPVRRRLLREDLEVLSGDGFSDNLWARSGLGGAQRDSTVTKPEGITEQLLQRKKFPDGLIFVRLRIGQPSQSW